MAGKNNKKNKSDNEAPKKEGGKFSALIVVLVLLLIWISAFAVLIKIDLGNLGTTLRPYLKDVPVLNLILPTVSDKDIAYENNSPYTSFDEALAKIEELSRENGALKAENEKLTKQNSEYGELFDNLGDFTENHEKILAIINRLYSAGDLYNSGDREQSYAELMAILDDIYNIDRFNGSYADFADLVDELDRLRGIEKNYKEFQARVDEFDKEVIFGTYSPDVSEYIKYYEKVNPESAQKYYELAKQLTEIDNDIKVQADLLASMKPANAAAILEEMTADVEWAAKVLLTMKKDTSTAILDKMSTLNAAKLFKKMSDMSDEKLQDIYDVLKD